MSLAASFFHETAKPTAEEFLENMLNVRRGRLAAIVLYHVADYWFEDNRDVYADVAAVHLEVIGLCPEFQTIRDVADATKHAELRPQTKIPRTLSASKQAYLSEGLFTAPFGHGVFAEALEIVVELDDRSQRSLAIAVNAVLDFWQGRV